MLTPPISAKSLYGRAYKPNKPLNERIAQKCHRTQKGCLEWTGSVSSTGYPVTQINYKMHRVSRLIWEQTYGPIAPEHYMCHKCDNPLCVEITHLFAGTAKENMQDAVEKGRIARGNRLPQTKITANDVIEIRRLLLTQPSTNVSRLYGISPRHCRAIGSRTMWKHIL